MSKPSRKQCKKHLDGECLVCKEKRYTLLDAHRIIEGGTYHPINVVTLCVKCHRLTHTGEIRFDRKYLSTHGLLLHWFLCKTSGEVEEMWTPVIN